MPTRLTLPQLKAAHLLARLAGHAWSRVTWTVLLDAHRDGGVEAIVERLEQAILPERLTTFQKGFPHVQDGHVHERQQCGGHVEWIIGEDGTVTLSAHRDPNLAGLHALAEGNGGQGLLLREALDAPRLTTVASVTIPADDRDVAVYELGDPRAPRLEGRPEALPEHLDALRACAAALIPLYPGRAADAVAWLDAQAEHAAQTERAEHSEMVQQVLGAGLEATLLRDAISAFEDQAARLEREEAVNAAALAVFEAVSSPQDMVALAEGMLERARLQLQVSTRPGGR